MDLLGQLSFESEDSKETQTIRAMKERMVRHPDPRGDKLVATFKISRDRHGQLLAAVDKHSMTITDVLTVFIDEIIPVLQKAKPVDVMGWKEDRRTKTAVKIKEMRGRARSGVQSANGRSYV